MIRDHYVRDQLTEEVGLQVGLFLGQVADSVGEELSRHLF
jgi:hypothetical protein